MGFLLALMEILKIPTSLGGVIMELVMFIGPLWIAVFVGIFFGWSWKPKWVNLISTSLLVDDSSERKSDSQTSPPPPPPPIGFGSIPSLKLQMPSFISWVSSDNGVEMDNSSSMDSSISKIDPSSSELKREGSVVTEDDLEHLSKLVEVKDGGPDWFQVMDRSTHNMSYQAWRRDPETGPPQYRSSTVYEDATPELLRDFFWDDEFRAEWDHMLIGAETLEECPTTGTMIVKWIRKFPFFCSDREYIIGRQIWDSGRSYYCITKGVPYPSVPRHSKPRRVDLYYSSWCIRAVESRRGNGQMTACEVLLFHHEDMGIPWEIAKLGVRQGMWGAVKMIDRGVRAYQTHRLSAAPLSHSALMAHINTKVSTDYLRSLEESTINDSSEVQTLDESSDHKDNKPLGRNIIPKFVVVGGAIALACSLDRGLVTKAVIFGVARRFANLGRRL